MLALVFALFNEFLSIIAVLAIMDLNLRSLSIWFVCIWPGRESDAQSTLVHAMTSIGTGYDLSASTYSPDGRIFQAGYELSQKFALLMSGVGRVRE